MFIWDVQTGVKIKHINTAGFGEIFFHGDQRVITLIKTDVYSTFNLYKPREVPWCWDKLLSSKRDQGSVYQAHNDSFWVVTSSNTEGNHVVNIQKLQPSSDPPVLMVESFPIPPQHGTFSFSPVSSHASFVTENEVTILNVQDSKILLLVQETQQCYSGLGCFSPDGHFFTCGASENRIYIWENTPAGYIFWGTLQPRLPFNKFSFSPTGTSILTWGPEGIQLLHLENSTIHLPPNETEPLQCRKHLVACSADGKHIVTAQKGDNIITALDPILGTLLWPIFVGGQIQDIKIVDNILFVADGHKLLTWNLRTGEMFDSARGLATSGVCDTVAVSAHMDNVDNFVLSSDCSHIAFTIGSTVFFYNTKAQKILTHIMDGVIEDIFFSYDGHQLCVFNDTRYTILCFPKFKAGESWCSKDVTKHSLVDRESWVNFFQSPHGYSIERMSEWVGNSRDVLLWLPPNWRTKYGLDVRWDGNFLALVGSHHKKPIIVEFQPQPPSNSHSACLLNP